MRVFVQYRLCRVVVLAKIVAQLGFDGAEAAFFTLRCGFGVLCTNGLPVLGSFVPSLGICVPSLGIFYAIDGNLIDRDANSWLVSKQPALFDQMCAIRCRLGSVFQVQSDDFAQRRAFRVQFVQRNAGPVQHQLDFIDRFLY